MFVETAVGLVETVVGLVETLGGLLEPTGRLGLDRGVGFHLRERELAVLGERPEAATASSLWIKTKDAEKGRRVVCVRGVR